MGKKNSQLHLYIETDRLAGLKIEAMQQGVGLSELIRLKLFAPPLPNEIALLRKLKEELLK